MVRSPLHFHGRIPVPEVAPLTYRDGVTQLELVYELSQYLKNILHPSLQSTVNQVVADAERLLSDANEQYVDGVQEFQRIHDAFMSDVNARLIALNDGAVTDLVNDESSLFGSTIRTMTAPPTAVYVKPTGGDDTVALQEACDEAGLNGVVRAYGEFNISGRVWASGSFDGSGATVTVTSPEGGFGFGDPDHDDSRSVTIHAPKMRHTGFTREHGWGDHSIGIIFSNLVGAVVTINDIANFTTGMLVIGQNGRGCVYNTFTIGRLTNNKRNQVITSDTRGWCNNNTYIGGQYSHLNSLQEFSDGVEQILVQGGGAYGKPNGNTWINPSIETTVAQYMMNMDNGTHNTIVGARFEDADNESTIRWGTEAQKNVLFGGFYLDRVREVHEPGSSGNAIYAPNHLRVTGGMITGRHPGGVSAANSSGTGRPIFTAHQAGWKGELDKQDEWVWQVTTNDTRWKRPDDSHPRVKIRHTGQLDFGSGSDETDAVIFRNVLGLALGGDRIVFQRHNTMDLGTRTQGAPRIIHAGTALNLGLSDELPSAGGATRGDIRRVTNSATGADELYVCLYNGSGLRWEKIA